MQIYSKNKQVKRILAGILTVIMVLVSIDLGQFISVQAATEHDTLYLIDNTAEKWVKNDNAKIKAIDNSNGHTAYWMTQKDETTWSVKIPKNAYNITFNRYAEDKTTQWNSWSAGGRDKNNAYYVDGSEYGHWETKEESGFEEGDIIYLDLTEFTDWVDQVETTLYANFTTATKENNAGNNVIIESADRMLYDPYSELEKVEEYIYKYKVTHENAGKRSMRFWRGNDNVLWNCSCLMKYEDYENGNNCIKVTGWDNNGEIAKYDDIDTEISINTDGLEYNKNAKWYYIEDEISALTGKISNTNNIKKILYNIRDINDNIVKQGVINISDEWIIKDFGLVVGYNDVSIVAEKGNGKIVKKSVHFMNINVKNMESMDVDLNDNDGDGLNNYFESLYGTDINEVDTDGDGLSDFSEIIITGTNPLIKDTDNNGITDGNEDFDEDGLTNIEEIKLGTNCYLEDTDGDKITDGDEVNKYFTNPLIKDTDEDGLSDYEDIVLQFDPNKADTDNNGVLDGNESVEQKYTEKIDSDDKKGITGVSVSLECSGYIDNLVSITNTYKLDTRSSDVVGLIGVPVEISCDSEFSTAEITFAYDEKALGETSEDDLCMMWYDEENDNYVLLEDSKVDKKNHIITYSTTHFSTYLIVDKKIWLDNMRMDMNYRTYGETIYYDVAFVVDVSSSMSGTRITTAKNALNSFTDALLEGDQAGLIRFNSNAYIVQELTPDIDLIKNAIGTLSTSGGTRADLGISRGITMLDGSSGLNQKMIILICDGDVSYNTTLVQSAKEKEIKIHCINVVNGTSTAMEQMAKETGGTYYYAATTENLSEIISELQGNTVGYVDPTDSDGDGLYDVYEVNGMRLSNGKIVYTDPNKTDTDGDGVSDYDAMGGAPVIETYMLNGNTYSCTLNHSTIYGTLPEDFIFVDGTLNTDGQQYYGKMGYIPYSNNFIHDKYEKEENVYMFGEQRVAAGAAGVYNLYSDKLADMSYLDLAGYASVGTLTAVAIGLGVSVQAGDCLYTYVRGDGGEAKGLAEGSTRKYLYSSNFIDESVFGINSANKYFKINMAKAVAAVETVLNEYNTEVYLSLSPNKNWTGCDYHDCTGFSDWYQNIDALLNIPAFGIYNAADAAVTLHCTYNPASKTYSMEYIYYIIDYYDFSFYDMLNEMNALGLAQSYELYGVCKGETVWEKGKTPFIYWLY